MKFPKTLKIGAHIYKIIYPYIFDVDAIGGQHCPETNEIKIKGRTSCGEIQSDVVSLQVFFHEVIHIINQIYCMNQLGKECDVEELIDALAEGIVQVLVDNNLYNGKVERG